MSKASIFLCHDCYKYLDDDEDLLRIYSHIVKDFVADGKCIRANLECDDHRHPFAELEHKGYIISTDFKLTHTLTDYIEIRPISCKHLNNILPDLE